jgi:hypothetical protein
MLRYRPFVLVGAVVGTMALLATSEASASSSSRPSRHQRLELHTVVLSSATNGAGHGGPGDVIALHFDVRNTKGAHAGTADISCTVVTADVQLCHAGFVLADGQIEAQASIPMTATTFDAAVIGGTGAYRGVTGEVSNIVTAPGVIDRTFELSHP